MLAPLIIKICPWSAVVRVVVHGIGRLPLLSPNGNEKLVSVQQGHFESVSPVDGNPGTSDLDEKINFILNFSQNFEVDFGAGNYYIVDLAKLELGFHSLVNLEILQEFPSCLDGRGCRK